MIYLATKFAIPEMKCFVMILEHFCNLWQTNTLPDSKVHGANMGPMWGRQDPGGPHVGPMNFAIWAGMNI